MSDVIFGQLGVDIIVVIQTFLSPTFDLFFKIITALGTDVSYIMIIALIYYLFDKRAAIKMAFVLIFSAILVETIKGITAIERPYQKYSGVVTPISTASSYSFPSGHATSAATFWPILGDWLSKRVPERKSLIVAVVITAIGLVSFSRVYLGVHYPGDVIVGIILGLMVSLTFLKYETVIMEKINLLPFSYKLILAVVLPFGAFYLHIVLMIILGHDFSVSNLSTVGGLFLGLGCGVLLEDKYVSWQIPQTPRDKVIGLIIGLIAVIVLFAVVTLVDKVFFSSLDPLISLTIRFFRYAILSFTLTFISPFMLKRLDICAK